MSVFRDQEHLYQCLGGLFDRLVRHPEIGPTLRRSDIIIRFIYHEPDAAITAICTEDTGEDGLFVRWVRGDAGREAQVTMEMQADVAHRFWLGKVSLPIALVKRDIVARGPLTKIMKLLPVIKPAYAIYPEVLKAIGQESMIAADGKA